MSADSAPPFVATDEQRAAIEHPLAPLLVVAGAGSGKTTVMARRIAHLVQTRAVRPDQVLGLTFSNKAAANLRQKVNETLGTASDVHVATYHGFGASLVAEHTLELDLAPGLQVLDKARAWQLLFDVFDEFVFELRKTGRPGTIVDDALQLASRCADHLVPVERVVHDCLALQAAATTPAVRDTARKRLELCQVVQAYERRKSALGFLDYGDQIRLAVRLLETHPDVAAGLRERFPVVLLDEYQDTNAAQRRLLQLVYPAGASVTAVGDDMQAIYAFRGAEIRNIRRFPDDFPPASQAPLQVNFRSGPRLVELANRIQAKVPAALPKALAARDGAHDTELECFLAADDAAEAEAIADDIVAAAARTGGPWSRSAVLCRKRRLISAVVEALVARDIPVEVIGLSGLLTRPEVIDVVSWLEIVGGADARVATLRILEGPRYRLGIRDLAALARGARLRHAEQGHPAGPGTGRDRDLLDALDDLGRVKDLSPEGWQRCVRFTAERDELAGAARRLPLADLVDTVIATTGLWASVEERGRENLLRLCDLASSFLPVRGEPTLPAFLEYLQLVRESEDDLAEAIPSRADAVQVMTIHQAKGLEFDVVYVPGLAGSTGAGIFPDARVSENPLTVPAALPWWLRLDTRGIDGPPATKTAADRLTALVKDERLEEEWRLLYVAVTRARHRLVCSAAHWYPPTTKPQGPSPFYEFVAAQADLVNERFRHDAALVDPADRAKQARADRYGAAVDDVPIGETGLLWAEAGRAPVAAPVPPVPPVLSVSSVVSYVRCPRQFFWSVVQPLPRRSSPAARLGTEGHRWIEAQSTRPPSLFDDNDTLAGWRDVDDAPGASAPDVRAGLQRSFLASPYAAATPLRVESAFALLAGGRVVRGRVDAAYERDGVVDVVDFKTGRPPATGDPSASTQLDLYGLAALSAWGVPVEQLRTSYCYLRVDGPAEIVSFDWTRGRADEARATLASAMGALDARRFDARAGAWCARCDFRAVCPAAADVTSA